MIVNSVECRMAETVVALLWRHSHSRSTMPGGSSVATREWDRSRAVGTAAVDLTNLFLNPQKPSAINLWQVPAAASRA